MPIETINPETETASAEQQHAAEEAQAEKIAQVRAQLEEEKLRYRVELKIVGREEAIALLSRHAFNRNRSKAHVAKLAKFMRDNVWRFNGCAVVLADVDDLGIGEGLDGGHRLEAVVHTGIPQLFVVVTGVNPDVFETYDIYNKKRTSSDHLFVLGERNPDVLAEALNWLAARVEMNADEERTSLKRWHKPGLLHLHRKAVLVVHPQIREYVNKYAPARRSPRIPRGLLATLEYLMAQRDAAEAERFMARIMAPQHLSENDAAYVFLEWFRALPTRKRLKKDNCRIADAITVAWNATRNNETITAIRIPNGPLAFR